MAAAGRAIVRVGGGNGGLRPPGGGVGGGPVNRPGPGGGNGVVRPPGGAQAAGRSIVPAEESETEPCARRAAADRSIVQGRAAARSADPAGGLAAPSGCLARAAGPGAGASQDKREDSRPARRRAAVPLCKEAEPQVIVACRVGRLITVSKGAAADIVAVAAVTGEEGARIMAGAGVVNGAGRARERAMTKVASRNEILLARAALALLLGFAALDLLWYGLSTDELQRLWRNIVARPGGPMTFRFVLQPTMASIAALRDGFADARSDRRPYLSAVLFGGEPHRAPLWEGVLSTARIIILSLVMDVAYQLVFLDMFHPGESVVIAILLAFLPYALMRGPAAHLARAWLARRALLRSRVLRLDLTSPQCADSRLFHPLPPRRRNGRRKHRRRAAHAWIRKGRSLP